MIMNIYTIQDLDLDVKNFHNKFNSSILSTLPISLSVLVATGFALFDFNRICLSIPHIDIYLKLIEQF